MHKKEMDNLKNQKKKFQMPHVFFILFMMMILVWILSYLVPSGSFEKSELGVVNPNKFSTVPQENPIDVMDFFSSIYTGFVEGGTIIASLLISAGCLGILNSTGALTKGVQRLTQITNGKNTIILVIFFLYFAGMNILGAGEGVYPFFPIVTSIIVSLGYDRLMGAAVIMYAATAGFACGMVNMFTTGISQQIVGLPMFSGIGYRFIVFVILFSIGITSVLMYGRKIKKDPNKSHIAESYKKQLQQQASQESVSETVEFTLRHKLALIIFIGASGFIAYGCLRLGFTLAHFSAIYAIMAIALAFIFKINPNTFCKMFTDGASQVLAAAFAIGLARSVMVLLTQAQILDTIVYYMGSVLKGQNAAITLLLIFLFVTTLNFLVVSGSGKAVMMMPIMSPLGKMLGINQQVMVLTYQLGDGLTNMLWPGGGLISCALCGINYGDWLKMAWKTFALMIASGYILIVIANAIGYGPF